MFTGKLGKSHAAHLSPFPCQLIPFKPLDGPDTDYGQLYKALEKDSYKDASIKGFQPYEPYREEVSVTSLLSLTSTPLPSCFPTLAELNAEMDDWTVDKRSAIEADNDVYVVAEAYLTPVMLSNPPPPDVPEVHTPPLIGDLSTKLGSSLGRLFFISHKTPGTAGGGGTGSMTGER